MVKSANGLNFNSEPQEIPGKPGIRPRTPDEADRIADELIHKMMVDQKRSDSRRALPNLATEKAKPVAGKVKHPRRLFKLRCSKEAAPVSGTPKIPAAKKQRPSMNVAGQIRAVAGRIRAKPQLVAWLLVAAVFLWRPWLIPILLLVTFFTVLVAYFSLGPDRVAELVVTNWKRLRARRPELAETIRLRAVATAKRIDAVLDRLPEKWTDGLHVPDFAPPENELDNLPDPFERLANKAQHG